MLGKFTHWEERLLPTLQEPLQNIFRELESITPKVFFDIGANTGLIAENVHERFPDWDFYLFEPVKDYADYCSEKFKEHPNIKVFNAALSNFNGTTSISKCSSNLGYNTISTLQDYGDKEEVITQTLDSFLEENNIKEIGFIKLDVEQYESYVIEGSKNYFSNCKSLPTIITEIGSQNGHPCWDRVCKMFEFLFSVGYNKYDYHNIHSATDILLKPHYDRT